MHRLKVKPAKKSEWWGLLSTIGDGLICNIGHLLIHFSTAATSAAEHSTLTSPQNDKCESIQSRVKRRVLLPRVDLFFCFSGVFFFFFFACMGFPSCHFPFWQPTGRWEENDEVGRNNRDFLFRHRSIFVNGSIARKKSGRYKQHVSYSFNSVTIPL